MAKDVQIFTGKGTLLVTVAKGQKQLIPNGEKIPDTVTEEQLDVLKGQGVIGKLVKVEKVKPKDKSKEIEKTLAPKE